MTKTEDKKLGRPTKYREWMDEKIIELAKQGRFMYQIAAYDFEVAHKNMIEWTKKHPSFRKAYMRAKDICVSNLLQKGFENLENHKFNSKVFELILITFSRNYHIEGESVKEMSQSLKRSIACGDIQPDQYKTTMEGLRTAYDIEVGCELAERLEKLEEKVN